MAESALSLDIEYFPDPTRGRPVFNGSVYIGSPNTDPEVLANRVSVTIIQEDNTRVTIAPASQPLSTGAGGVVMYGGSPVVVRVSGEVSVKVLDSLGVQVYYAPAVNISTTASNEGVLAQNGSFELDSQTAGQPDNWTISAGSNGTVAIDSISQAHGLKSLKFTGTDATGGGTATSDKFNVLAGGTLDIRFTYKSSAINTLNKIDIKYYDASGSAISTASILSEGAANPLTYTAYVFGKAVPATAVQAEIILTGIDGTGAVVIGSTNFDDFRVLAASSADRLVDSNGLDVLLTSATASAVNEITATNAATGNAPKLEPTGTDTNINLTLQGKGTGKANIDGDAAGQAGTIASQGPFATLSKSTEVFTGSGTFTAPAGITSVSVFVIGAGGGGGGGGDNNSSNGGSGGGGGSRGYSRFVTQAVTPSIGYPVTVGTGGTAGAAGSGGAGSAGGSGGLSSFDSKSAGGGAGGSGGTYATESGSGGGTGLTGELFDSYGFSGAGGLPNSDASTGTGYGAAGSGGGGADVGLNPGTGAVGLNGIVVVMY